MEPNRIAAERRGFFFAELFDMFPDPFAPEVTRSGDAFRIHFPAIQVELNVSRVVTGKDDFKCWLDARSEWPGAPKRLFAGTFNLSGPRARTEMAKTLGARFPTEVDWSEVLERTCMVVIDAVQEGSPTLRITDILPREGSRFRVEPLAFERQPVIWFGKGGSGKSTLAAVMAISLHADVDVAGLPLIAGPVLICDWETDGQTYREQIELICRGHGIPVPDIHYRECMFPLTHEAESIGRYIDREGIEVVFVDSLGQAAGADKNSQEVATGMFSAMRQWRTTNLLIDHIAKAEDTNTPYGSTYFETSARATWRAKGAMQEGSNEHFLTMTLEKSNLGRYPAVAFRFAFLPDAAQPEAIEVQRVETSLVPESLRTDATNAKAKLREAFQLTKVAMTLTDLALAAEMREQPTRTRIGEMVKTGEVVKIIIRGAANKYALKTMYSERDEASG